MKVYKTINTRFIMDSVIEIAVNRADKLNALNIEVLEELADAIRFCDSNTDIRIIVLTGSGEKSFIAGSDVLEMSEMSPLDFRYYAKRITTVVRAMSDCEKPIIAKVKGFCFGGGNIIAMYCDLVFATEKSLFGQQEINLGLVGGISRLIYIVGLRNAFDILLTGRVVDAKKAEEIGLINKCLSEDEFNEYILNSIKTLLEKPAVSLALIKSVKNMVEKECLEYFQTYENAVMSICVTSDDAHEGMNAFIEKRKPNYIGK